MSIKRDIVVMVIGMVHYHTFQFLHSQLAGCDGNRHGTLPYIPVFGEEWTKQRSPIFCHSVFGPKPFQPQEQPDKDKSNDGLD